MPGINWGALAPIQGPQAVGQVAPANPDSTVGAFGQGIMSGMAQGSSIAANNQNVAASKQDMAQKAALFPSQLTQSQNLAAASITDLKTKQQAFQDAANIRAATKQGDDAVYKAMYAADPVSAIKFLQTKSDLAKGIAETADKVADTKSKNLVVQQQTSGAIANIYSSAYQAEQAKPGSGQKVLDIKISQLDPDTQKMLAANGMTQYSDGNVAAAHSVGQEALAQIQQQKEAKDAPTIVKLQNSRDMLQAKISNGTATDQDKQNINEINTQISGIGRANVESPQDKINVATSTDAIKNAHDQAQKNLPIIANLEAFKQQMGGFNVGAVAPTDIKIKQYMQGIGQALGLQIKTNAGVGEELESISSQLKLQIASQIKNARMSRPMLAVVSNIPPGVENTPQGNKLMVDRLGYLMQNHNAFTDFQDQYVQKNGSVSGVEKAWSNFLGSAPLIKADGSFNEQHLQDDSSQYLDPKFKGPVAPIKEAPSTNSTSNALPQVPAGRVVVKDSKGNIGHIPANQLQDALKSGYTQVTQ